MSQSNSNPIPDPTVIVDSDSTQNFSVRIKRAYMVRLAEIAAEHDRPISWEINKAIEEYINDRAK